MMMRKKRRRQQMSPDYRRVERSQRSEEIRLEKGERNSSAAGQIKGGRGSNTNTIDKVQHNLDGPDSQRRLISASFCLLGTFTESENTM